MRYADKWVVSASLFLLLVVSFLPFPTKLMAEAIKSTSAERIAVLFYGGTRVLISVLGRYVAGQEALLAEGVGKDDVPGGHRRGRAHPGLLRAAAAAV